ncbi:DUF192 domain-containing protein [Candidatus Pacearchaeota archaeon]|jgi:uncharacterized membrane protein (UPF0127 family)|nr:DUF192 domain-containing protein [Candidatus Pacearchaeota archaeon]
MKKKKITIHAGGKKIKLPVEECNLFEKFTGLMFSKKEKAKILLFSFKRKQKIRIHSFFVFYPFIAVWLGEKNRVIDIKLVRPFTPCVAPKKPAFILVEIPLNEKNRKITQKFLVTDEELETFKYPRRHK